MDMPTAISHGKTAMVRSVLAKVMCMPCTIISVIKRGTIEKLHFRMS